jgi:Protein of unknown function (DUF2892)
MITFYPPPKHWFGILLLCVCSMPSVAVAHQPRITVSQHTIVDAPEISKAYYGKLTGTPHTYTIQANEPFDLYVNVLVPDIENQKKDVSVTIAHNDTPIAVLDGMIFPWKQVFEPFGYDAYWEGPEYRAPAPAGTYQIIVASSNNDSAYSLAIGEIEYFTFTEILNALTLVPQLKQNFFNESPISFIFSPFGWGLILVLYILAGVVGLGYRYLLTAVAKGTTRGALHNIRTRDRVIRFAISLMLLLWAITTNWSMVLIFLSGFALFEALFSWCGLYAALGKNTCPVT